MMNTKWELDQQFTNGRLPIAIEKSDEFEVVRYSLIVKELITDLHNLHLLSIEQWYEEVHKQYEEFLNDQSSVYNKLFCPIYFITYFDKDGKVFTDDDIKESIVYVGKTNSKTNRFINGHRATQSLLEPWFNQMEKRLYMAQVWVEYIHNGIEYNAPLEWIKPIEIIDDFITFLEYFLIFQEEPFVNMDGVDSRSRKTNFRTYNDYWPIDDISGFKIIMDTVECVSSPYLEDLSSRITREAMQDLFKEVVFRELKNAFIDDDYEE